MSACPLCGETTATDGKRVWCNGDQCEFEAWINPEWEKLGPEHDIVFLTFDA